MSKNFSPKGTNQKSQVNKPICCIKNKSGFIRTVAFTRPETKTDPKRIKVAQRILHPSYSQDLLMMTNLSPRDANIYARNMMWTEREGHSSKVTLDSIHGTHGSGFGNSKHMQTSNISQTFWSFQSLSTVIEIAFYHCLALTSVGAKRWTVRGITELFGLVLFRHGTRTLSRSFMGAIALYVLTSVIGISAATLGLLTQLWKNTWFHFIHLYSFQESRENEDKSGLRGTPHGVVIGWCQDHVAKVCVVHQPHCHSLTRTRNTQRSNASESDRTLECFSLLQRHLGEGYWLHRTQTLFRKIWIRGAKKWRRSNMSPEG